jgi:hypothetical protein
VRVSVADRLVAQARQDFEFFHDPAGEAWAWDGAETFRIGSSAFADRLARDLYLSTGKAPAKVSLTTAATALRALSLWDGPEHAVFLRIANHEGRVVVDLADAEHRVSVIDEGGWTITTESPVRFQRPEGMLPLPLPVKGGNLEVLEDLWPVSGEDLVLVVGWVLGCLNPSGPKPLLDLSGTQGSGKSTLARMLRSLLDPNAVMLQTMPSDSRNLAVIGARHAVLAFDNASKVSDEFSDALCRLSTGGGYETRKLYTDDGVVKFNFIRPVIVTGIPEIAKQGDLVDRTISITLPEFGEEARRTETEVAEAFEETRPGLLGVLFDAVSAALANLPTVVLAESPRMLDFATWVEAGAPAFGWGRGRFLKAYVSNRRQASAGIIESTFIGQFIPELATEGFVGTATQAYRRLEVIAGSDATRRKGWPLTPSGLVGVLRRLAPSLRNVGVVVAFDVQGESGTRLIRIHRADATGPDGDVIDLTAATRVPRAVRDVVGALLTAGVDETWRPTESAALALQKATGDASVAAAALNVIGIPAPRGTPWTADFLRGVI